MISVTPLCCERNTASDRRHDHDPARMPSRSIPTLQADSPAALAHALAYELADGLAHAHPRAFASSRGLTREDMIGAPVRWPRPTRLEAPLELPAGKMADGMEALGLSTVGALLEHLPDD